MTYADLWDIFRHGFAPAAMFIGAGVLFVYLLARIAWRVKAPELALFVITFGTLGGVLGYATGNSRQATVGPVLAALLTFLAGTLTYLFSQEHTKNWKPVLPFCIFVLVLNAFFGLFAGSTLRAQEQARERRYAEWKYQYEHVYMEIQKASGLDLVRSKDPRVSQIAPTAPPY